MAVVHPVALLQQSADWFFNPPVEALLVIACNVVAGLIKAILVIAKLVKALTLPNKQSSMSEQGTGQCLFWGSMHGLYTSCTARLTFHGLACTVLCLQSCAA